MIEALIIEDEKYASKQLEKLLLPLNIRVVAVLHSVENAVQWFKQNTAPELIFSDIQLGDGLSFSIFESVSINSFIIFTTAYNEYSLLAFKLNRIDYLLKPINPKELESAVAKYKQFKPLSNFELNEVFQSILKKETVYKKRFLVPFGNQLYFKNVEDISCFYTENKVTYLQTEKSIPISETLEEIESQINPDIFFRVNRQYIVQRAHIKQIKNHLNHRLSLQIHYHTQLIIVSRERVKGFKIWLEKM